MKQGNQHILATVLFTTIYLTGLRVAIDGQKIDLDTRLILFSVWLAIVLCINMTVVIHNDTKNK